MDDYKTTPVLPPTYFKYTGGESFTLNDVEYSGIFHVIDGVGYTKRKPSKNSEKLDSKDTLLNEIFLKKLEFDDKQKNSSLNRNYSNVFDILNKNQSDELFGSVHDNNLLVYKSLIGYNSKIFNFDNNFHFYGLSSTDVDIRDNDIPSGKTTVTHIDPFSFSDDWYFLDLEVQSSNLLVKSDDSFTYNVITENLEYKISGSFSNTDPIELETVEGSSVVEKYIDEEENRIYIVDNGKIKIFNWKRSDNCDINNLIKEIPYGGDTNIIKFGDLYRLEVDSSEIRLIEKESSKEIESFSLKELGVGEILDADIRNVDDYVVILHRIDGEVFLVQLFDGEYSNIKLYDDVDSEGDVGFSNFDSNVFFIQRDKRLEMRLFTVPTSVVGKINESNLLYIKDYIYNTTYDKFGVIPIKWNSNKLKSNYYNPLNLETFIVNNKLYVLLHAIGRIYVSKQENPNVYSDRIPLDLERRYSELTCSESSLGIQINNELYKLIQEIVEIYISSSRGIDDEILGDVFVSFNDLYLNSNETVNVISLQRILDEILSVQGELISLD